MNSFILFIILVFVVESLVELLVKSEFFTPFRALLFKHRNFTVFNFAHKVLDCGYCTSVWISFFISFCLLLLSYIHGFVEWFAISLLIHRSSNLLHNIIDRTRKYDF